MTDPSVRPDLSVPIWFWIVSGILLAWNLMGLAVFGMTMSMIGNSEALKAAGLSDDAVDLMNSTPAWVNVAFGVAVVFGVIGCIVLLLRKKSAIPVLAVSLLGVLAQNTYLYFLSNSVEVMGVGLSPIVMVVAIALVPFAMFCAKQGWLK